MADKPKEQSGGGDEPLDWLEIGVYILIGYAILMFVVPQLLGRISFFRDTFCPSYICGETDLKYQLVISGDETEIYELPGTKFVTTISEGREGKVVGGPRTVNGVRYWLVDFKGGEDGWVSESDLVRTGAEKINNFVFYFKLVSGSISVLLMIGIGYVIRRINALGVQERERLYLPHEESMLPKMSETVVNQRWANVIEHINSEKPSDWKVAILEADIILDEMLDRMGYKGDSIGDKLKNVEPSDFLTLDDAWEAHKVRNRIAHQGTEFMMDHAEAKRIIDLYKRVFEEFYYI